MKHMFSDTPAFRRDPLACLVDKADAATEPLVPLNIGFRPVYLLADPEYIKPLLKTSEDLIDKGPMTAKFRAITGNNIIVLTGEERKRRHAVYHSTLARVVVERLTPVLASEVRRAIADVTRTGHFDARQFGASLALRLICIVAFGPGALSPAEEEQLIAALRQVENDLADEIFRSAPFLPWKRAERQRRRAAAKETMELIVRRVRERAPDAGMSRSLDELNLSDRDTASEILTLLLIGSDTTGSATAWLLHALATVPGLADRIAAESATVRDENGDLDYAKLSSASTALAATQEVLRLYPSAYWFARGTRQDMEFGGRRLRRGTSIMVSPWTLHHSARFWDAPEEFRLDRTYNTKAYLPFGTGPRVCVGAALAKLELEIIALEVASSLQLSLVGPVGAPLPAVHLTPPSMLMEGRDRTKLWAIQPELCRSALQPAAISETAEHSHSACPVHAREH
ncbi:cytochrome P450 [Phyllobacterium phragmitis]|uniref:Cytochrome P450 n=1 Tax=Phyllobacterium phragmitis TaxID=2670329 RepID=A0A2S9IJK8_9HYPH|nr:cytochrome P450 [Phyllobacterium phragmitis]PRD40695.1 cytochrome P450 [Phyllobacterium phragmitis]